MEKQLVASSVLKVSDLTTGSAIRYLIDWMECMGMDRMSGMDGMI